jgi:hypothetical protein
VFAQETTRRRAATASTIGKTFLIKLLLLRALQQGLS